MSNAHVNISAVSQLAFYVQRADQTRWQSSQVCGILGTDTKNNQSSNINNAVFSEHCSNKIL